MYRDALEVNFVLKNIFWDGLELRSVPKKILRCVAKRNLMKDKQIT